MRSLRTIISDTNLALNTTINPELISLVDCRSIFRGSLRTSESFGTKDHTLFLRSKRQ
jgi:hypothetical protein